MVKLFGYFGEAEKLWYLWIQLEMNWNILVIITRSGMTFKNISIIKKKGGGNSLVVQWLGLHAFTAKDQGSIPGQGTKIPQATWCGQKKIFFFQKFSVILEQF